ncbi:helix-turn-helix domain-containing protein [Pseudomonas gingeri]|uniref:Helix-turn-helix transcriptional regulator n=1 Tax=Pseudomonas gingeri TaxID=117681 RepID=A0A7Y7YF48_9PSED|nr:AraC family transcriptional regulator [Pseudomonas gingeri]NWA00264.1 helix-turn-helix transcriptional regulator [Pseudomonas gingeri]NWA12062.1 helix-turn-helix transcriptional regulator [Pseudomonas gingeri]NWA58661.1 helix-turn-helix transcriptional regulator [Pseudomonas gingeri]NWA98184.1 helix-turn-helix transcriptional regulator [Pseudomonas gingeri]NWB00444.1 helix-turn-helix transcriptional regulator [Pseudomonas gingeri]
MAALDTLQVFQALNRSPNSRLEHSAEFGDGLSAALWSNHHDAQDYEAPSHHTLSCYIAGGTGTFRRDRPDNKGGPDRLCILPAEHQSGWVINGSLRLAHVYISQEQFALECITLLDREPRAVHLQEATFLEDAQQVRRFHQLLRLNWNEPGERLLGSSLAHEMLSHMLLNQAGLRQGLRVKGGLAAYQRRLLTEYIDSQLDQPLSLGQLAGLCSLSEYHFARMFRTSFGLPPHQYVLARRLSRARELLRATSQPLGEIALACGFASASHFSNRLRQVLGATPGDYRQAFAH